MNDPEEFVLTSIICPVALFVTVILAPVITAPEGSLTVPRILPVPTVVCADKQLLAFTSVKKRKGMTNRTLLAVLTIAATVCDQAEVSHASNDQRASS